MPRFYFDLRQDGELVSDEDGQELASNDAAHVAAIQIATDLVKDLWFKTPQCELTIEVRDEHGRRVLAANPHLNVIRLDGEFAFL